MILLLKCLNYSKHNLSPEGGKITAIFLSILYFSKQLSVFSNLSPRPWQSEASRFPWPSFELTPTSGPGILFCFAFLLSPARAPWKLGNAHRPVELAVFWQIRHPNWDALSKGMGLSSTVVYYVGKERGMSRKCLGQWNKCKVTGIMNMSRTFCICLINIWFSFVILCLPSRVTGWRPITVQ